MRLHNIWLADDQSCQLLVTKQDDGAMTMQMDQRSRRSYARTPCPHTAPLRSARADRTDRIASVARQHVTGLGAPGPVRCSTNCETWRTTRRFPPGPAARSPALCTRTQTNPARPPPAAAPLAPSRAHNIHTHSTYLTSTTDPGVVDRCAGGLYLADRRSTPRAASR